MTSVAVASVMSLSITSLILAALVGVMFGRVMPPKPVAAVGPERAAQYRYAADVAEGYDPHSGPLWSGGTPGAGHGYHPPPPRDR